MTRHVCPANGASTWLVSILICTQACVFAQSDPEPAVVRGAPVVVRDMRAGDSQAANAQAAGDPRDPVLDRSWGQLASQTPNLYVETAGQNSFGAIFALRGLANTPYFSDPAVALYLDAIPLGSGFTYPSDLFGFASETVLLGPHPTESGRTGDAGTLILHPGARRGGGEARLGAGDFGSRSGALEAGASCPGGVADAFVAVAFIQRRGYVDNAQIGQRVDDVRARDAFAQVAFRPTKAAEVKIEVLGDSHRDGAAPLVPIGGPRFSVRRSQEGATDTDFLGAALAASLDTGLGRLTSVASYTDWRLDPYRDWLVLPPPLKSELRQSQHTWNEELRLASPPRGATSWDAGAWLSRGPTSGAADRSIRGVIPIEESDYGYTRREGALFGNFIAMPVRGLRISAGARAQRVEKEYHQDQKVPVAGLHLGFDRADQDLLPRVEADWDLDPKTTLQASAGLGVRPGGFAAYTDKPPLIPFAAEHVRAFEAGIRHQGAGDALSASARVFDYEIRNYQIERSFSPTDYFVATAPRARSYGGEVEAMWKPKPGWTGKVSAGLTNTTLLEFHDPLTGRDIGGGRAPYIPAYTSSVEVEYRSPSGWFVSATASLKGRTYYTESENAVYSQGAYAVASGLVGFESSRWRITGYVANATNQGYYSLIIPGVNSAAPGPPRTVGSELALKF